MSSNKCYLSVINRGSICINYRPVRSDYLGCFVCQNTKWLTVEIKFKFRIVKMTESVELDEIPLDDSTDEVEELDSRVQVMITMRPFILTDHPFQSSFIVSPKYLVDPRVEDPRSGNAWNSTPSYWWILSTYFTVYTRCDIVAILTLPMGFI